MKALFLALTKDRPFMSLTEEQLAFRDTVRKMVGRHVAPIAAEIDETDRFPLELVKLFGEMGLMQLWVPEKYGGPNGNLTMVCICREEISKVSPAGASLAAPRPRFDPRPQLDVHHAAAAFRLGGAAAEISAHHRRRRHRHRDCDFRTAG